MRILLVIILISSSTYQSPNAQAANFELVILFQSDQSKFDNIVQSLEQQWAPLFVSVKADGVPRTTYLEKLVTGNYDIALISTETIVSEFPPLWNLFSPQSFFGSTIYKLNSSLVSNSIGNETITSFLNQVNLYRQSPNLSNKIELAYKIQEIWNNNILLDIPIVSPSSTVHYWDSLAKFDPNEGLAGSLFKGLSWLENPPKRASKDRSVSEIQYSGLNFQNMRVPNSYKSNGEYRFLQLLFPTLFLKDKNNKIHPNLAVSFNSTELPSGGREWTIQLNENAFWSDNEPIDAYDVKFTLDLMSFDSVTSTNKNKWRSLEEVTIINNNEIKIVFSDKTLDQQFTLAQEFLLPEHILNDSSLYSGGSIIDLKSWNDFIESPVTGGAYKFNSAESFEGIILAVQFNNNYWFPNEFQARNKIFNLTLGVPQDVYYFNFDISSGLAIKDIYFHTSGEQIIETNSLLTTFQAGNRDILELPNLGEDNSIFSNSDITSTSIPVPGSGIIAVLNLKNRDLQDYDTRKGLTAALNRSLLVDFFGIGSLLQTTPVSAHYSDFYDESIEIPFSYDTAKNLFKSQGFEVLENPDQKTSFQWPWQKLPISLFSMISGLVFLMILRVRYYSRWMR